MVERCCFQVWPFLLGHNMLGSQPYERLMLDEMVRTDYERVMSEWLAVEAIVQQRNKEVVAAKMANNSQVWTAVGVRPITNCNATIVSLLWLIFLYNEMHIPHNNLCCWIYLAFNNLTCWNSVIHRRLCSNK